MCNVFSRFLVQPFCRRFSFHFGRAPGELLVGSGGKGGASQVCRNCFCSSHAWVIPWGAANIYNQAKRDIWRHAVRSLVENSEAVLAMLVNLISYSFLSCFAFCVFFYLFMFDVQVWNSVSRSLDWASSLLDPSSRRIIHFKNYRLTVHLKSISRCTNYMYPTAREHPVMNTSHTVPCLMSWQLSFALFLFLCASWWSLRVCIC